MKRAPSNLKLIATVIGPDRPGLVELLAETISANDGNWTESRMAHLAGQFAGMVLIEVAAENADSLGEALAGLSEKGLAVSVISGGEISEEVGGSKRWTLNLVGQDRVGIVSQISHAIASHGINVEELETETESAAMSGELLFRAKAVLTGPADADEDGIRESLEAIAHDLMVEVELAE